MKRLLLLGVSTLTATACSVGPDYARPTLEAPRSFSTADVAPVHSRWSRQFDDPTLDSLIERAVHQNLQIEQARERVLQARALRGAAARGAYLPQGGASGRYVRTRISEEAYGVGASAARAGLIDREEDFVQGGFDASWEVDVFGGQRRRVESADAAMDGAHETRRAVLLSVIAEVGDAYFALRGAQARLEVAEDAVETQAASLRLVTAKRRAGLAQELDEARARAQLAETRSQVPGTRAAIRVEQHRLAVLLGRFPRDLIGEFERPGRAPRLPASVGLGLPAELLARRPDLRRLERDVHVATATVGVHEAELYPRFFLIGSAGIDTAKLADLTSGSGVVAAFAPTLRWPIFSFPRLLVERDAAEHDVTVALLAYRQGLLEALAEVESGIARYAGDQAALAWTGAAVRAADDALRLSRLRYERGVQDLLDVLVAQGALLRLQDQEAALRARAARSLVLLFKSLGGGWEPFEEDAPQIEEAP